MYRVECDDRTIPDTKFGQQRLRRWDLVGLLGDIDMSEYKDYHSFEKLIGDPKHEKAGVLTEHVRKHPFSVVLLDEFDLWFNVVEP